MGTPNYNNLLASSWGTIFDDSPADVAVMAAISIASGVAQAGNPPYTLNDLAVIYPFFLGQATSFTGTTDGTTGTILVANTSGLRVGSLVTGSGISNGSYITAITNNVSITISIPTTTSAVNAALSAFVNPPVPYPVLNAYMALATASVYISRYGDSWYIMMALFIAHWATMWAMNNQSPNATLAQIAQSGVAAGIQIFKHAGDLSVNQQILDDLKGWGTYQLTSYGQQFASTAKVINTMSMLVY